MFLGLFFDGPNQFAIICWYGLGGSNRISAERQRGTGQRWTVFERLTKINGQIYVAQGHTYNEPTRKKHENTARIMVNSWIVHACLMYVRFISVLTCTHFFKIFCSIIFWGKCFRNFTLISLPCALYVCICFSLNSCVHGARIFLPISRSLNWWLKTKRYSILFFLSPKDCVERGDQAHFP